VGPGAITANDQDRAIGEQSCRVFVAARGHVARERERASRGNIRALMVGRQQLCQRKAMEDPVREG